MTHTSKAVELEIVKHPRFYIRRGLGVIKYDIAILTLEQPVDFTQFPHIRQDSVSKFQTVRNSNQLELLR